MRALPLDEVSSFEQRLERTWLSRGSWAKRRDAVVIGLGLCGLRWEEVSRVRVWDVVPRSAELSVRTAKKGCPRTVCVGLSLVCGLQRVWEEVPPRGEALRRGWAFYTATGGRLRYEAALRRVKAFTKLHFGFGFTFHCLRHTAACRCYLETNSVVAVQRLLGHKSLQHTTVYLSSLEVVRSGGLPSWVERRLPALRVFDPDGLQRERRAGA